MEKFKNFFQKFKQSKISLFFKSMTEIFAALWEKVKFFLKSGVDFTPPVKDKILSFVVQWWHWVLGGIFAFIVLYYPAGALFYHRIDLNVFFDADKKEEKIQMLDTLADLISRETDTYAFTPNLPFFFPAAVLDNMPAFQTGIIEGTQKIIATFSEINPSAEDLKQAADLLAYPVSIWHVNQWKPAVSSVKKYRTAKHLIVEFKEKVLNATQDFNLSAQSLDLLLTALAEDLKECVDLLEVQIQNGEKKLWDTVADNVFYEIKGQSYVYFLVLRDLKNDFKELFQDETLRKKWENAFFALKKAVKLQPLVVVNGSAETQFAPNHLLGLGFYLAQASLNLSEMTQSLKGTADE